MERQRAVHRTIMVVDVEGFGDRRRTNDHQVVIREALYRAVRQAFDEAGIAWTACRYEDRGDGLLVLAPADIPKAPFVEAVPHALAVALRNHNQSRPAEERIRLRMALHAGEVILDRHGVTATAVNMAFRLLDASPLKTALGESLGVLALITSGWFFEDVVRHSEAAYPTTFRPARVTVKETSTIAWIALPDHPYPPDPTNLVALPPEPATGGVPRQLPAAPPSFIGRLDELAALTNALNTAAGPGTPMVITAIAGAGGMGKTWLALHWAHQHLDRFPDGQLFVDLQGFSPVGEPLHPAVAVRGFLDALGVEPARVPTDPQARTALYRSLVAGKRILIVLDNAGHAAQVTPMLPGSSSCTVLVTSRRHLTSIITRHGARHLRVGAFNDAEARQTLTTRLPRQRVEVEPAAVAALLACCAGHPLALSIAAGRASTAPDVSLADLAAELSDATTRLDVLDDDDPAASLPAVLSWSLRGLSPEHRTVFELLGISPGPDIALPAATSLTGLPSARTRQALRALESASLLDRNTHGRYSMHDLIRAYATGAAQSHLDEETKDVTLRRVVDFYLHTARTADQLLDPHREPLHLGPPAPGSLRHPLPDYAAALGWFDTEHACLLAAQYTAIAHTWHQTVWQLAWVLTTFHYRRGHHHDRLEAWRAALATTEHVSDRTLPTHVHRSLGYAYSDLGHHEKAIEHLQQSLAVAERLDQANQAHTHYALAGAWGRAGNDHRALDHATHAARLFRAVDNPVSQARALNLVGKHAARLGNHDSAREHCQAALTLHQHHHDLDGEANALASLGYIAHQTGHHHLAIQNFQQAISLFRDLGYISAIAETLDLLGHPHTALGQHDHARVVWREALDLYQQQGRDDDAIQVQRRLEALSWPDGV